MRLLILMFIVGINSMLAASSYSQSTRITLKISDTRIEDVLNQIESKSEFYFLFNQKLIDLNRMVSIDVKEEKISVILDELFAGTEVRHQVLDRQIVLTISPATEIQGQPQERKVTGKVTDSMGGPIQGASVVVKGTTIGVTTDNDGKFNLSIPNNAGILSFSFVGMKLQEMVVGNKSDFNVVLLDEPIGLDEIVAVGYGFKKKINLTGSVASINSDVLKKIPPLASTTNALTGIIPGLITQQTTGSPGKDEASLNIRGFGGPLVIVDGVESGFNNIDPNEIESISVLKDASAAIYGSRAGNGVILVTTKRGIEGKPVITLNSSYSSQSFTNFPSPVSAGQYAEYLREGGINKGLSESQLPFTAEEVQKYYAGTDPNYPNTNWKNIILKPSTPMQQHNLSVRGGSDKIKYFGLLGYMDQKTCFKNSDNDFKRFNVRSNIDAKITDNLSIQIDISNINEFRKFPVGEDPQHVKADFYMWDHFWNTPAIWPASLPDPTKQPYTGSGEGTNAYSEYNRGLGGFVDTGTQNIKIGSAIKYNFPFVKGLSAKLFINYDQNYGDTKQMGFPIDTYTYDYKANIYSLVGSINKGVLWQIDNKSKSLTNQFSINYDRVFSKDHNISFMGIYESIDYRNDYTEAQRINYMSKYIQFLNAGDPIGQYASSSGSEMGRVSYIGRLNYSFKNKYLIETTIRADASAKFPPQKRWGYFPSFSAGWRISEESFIKDNIRWLSDLKLRGGVSNTGLDNVGNFQYLSGYGFTGLSMWGQKYVMGTDLVPGLLSTGLPNPDLTWENVSIYNIGLDYSLFQSKLYGEFDVFYRKLTGIPATRLLSLPSTFGASLPPENLNSSDNRGFEAKLGTRGKKGDFSWDLSGNVSWSRQKWIHYEEPDYSGDPDKVRVYQLSGQWTDRMMGYKTQGLYTSQAEINAMTFNQDNSENTSIKPGDIKYVDMNKDGKLDWKDKVVIGTGGLPHWMFGLSTNLGYKNFDLSFLFQGTGGNYTNISLPLCEEKFNERWTEANNIPHALFPRNGSIAQGGGFSDFYLKKAGYIRLKTLNFGYNLPKHLLKFAKIENLRIFFAGTNLITFSKLKKYSLDPEQLSWSGNPYSNFYPQECTITFGLVLTL